MGIKTDSRRQKRISKRQEEQAAADLGGRTQANSGATRLGGGADVRVQGSTRVECKFTALPYYILTYDDLEKLRKQALQTLEEPVFQIAFQDSIGRMDKYVVIPLQGDCEKHEILMVLGKSIRLHHAYLRANLSRARHCIFFGSGPRKFEIITWDKYLERRAAADA